MLVSATLRDLRHRAGLGQAELARRVGITPSVLNAYERGRRQPGADVFLSILRAAGYEPEWRRRRLDDVEQGRLDADLAAGRAAALLGDDGRVGRLRRLGSE